MFALEFLREPVWQELTWTLLHFLWEGLAVAVLLSLLLGILGVRRPRMRYLLCLGAMVVMVLCPIVTFFVQESDATWTVRRPLPTTAKTADAVRNLDPGSPPEFTKNPLEPAHVVLIQPSDEQVVPPNMAPATAVAVQARETRLWRYARDLQPYVLAGWFCGVVFLSSRLLLGVVGTWWLRRARGAVSSQLADSVARLSAAMGLRKTGVVCVSSRVREAMVVGVLRPMVLLPVAWAAEMTPEILEAVIAHELAHIRRWDVWAAYFQRLAETLLFYHPAVWWISRRVSSEREKCCDELAVAATGRRLIYAKALEQAAGARIASTEPALGSTFGGKKMEILERVSHVLGISVAGTNPRARWWPVGLLALLVLVAIYRVAFETPLPVLAEEKLGQSETSTATAEKPDTEAGDKTFSGKVLDESGAGVTDADVWLSMGCKSRRYEWSVIHVKADSQGNFTLKVPSSWVADQFPDSPVTFWAYAAGHQVGIKHAKPITELPFGNDVSNLVIQLKPATDTMCMVLNPAGQPVDGALVQPYYMTFRPTPEEVLRYIETRTDATGRAKLPAVGRQKLEKIRIITKDFGIQTQRYSDPEQPFQTENIIILRPVGRIEGQLIADKPEWTRGVRMNLETEAMIDTPPWLPEGFAEIKSDDRGQFVVPSIANGRLNFRAVRVDEKLPVRPQLPQFIDVEAGETAEFKIPMVRLVPVRGSVRVKDSNAPVAGAKIDARYGVQRVNCICDSQGWFTAEVLPGRVQLIVFDMSGKYVQLGDKYYEVPNQTEEFELPPLEVVPVKNVEGRVIDERDQPLANARINITFGNRIFGSGKSDTLGRFKLTGIPTTIDAAKAEYSIVQGSDPWRKELENKVIKTDPLVIRVQMPPPTDTSQPPVKEVKPLPLRERPKRSAPIAPGQPLGISVEKADLMGRVEWAFMHGARDITARKTIEWGDVEKDADGNRKIRYKFYATIWDKDVFIMNKVFTFDAQGNILDTEDVDGFPQKKVEKPADVGTQAGMKELVADFFSKNFRDITAREDIEWGVVEKTDGGNSSIRYKYRAKIWDKDVKIMNQVFTFDPKGKYVSVKNVDGH